MYNRSEIVRTANKLATTGLSKSQAFKRAWALAKGQTLYVKGVTKGNRQTALDHIKKYQPEEVSFSLVKNSADYFEDNTLEVIATINEKSYCVGYLPSSTSELLSKVLEYGTALKSQLKQIVGGNGLYYGLRINAQMIA
ncbi:hypothetical protein Q5O24_11945 [Eubacteriaceae bacterium ES3]|nr:hypothetical protein Q5O24_11945 [Eubacteriaceae bacterium ES3]